MGCDSEPVLVLVLSDTHGKHGRLRLPNLGGGRADFAISAGDYAVRDPEFARFMAGLPATHKVVVRGNHDDGRHGPLQHDVWEAHGVHLLEDRTITRVCARG